MGYIVQVPIPEENVSSSGKVCIDVSTREGLRRVECDFRGEAACPLLGSRFICCNRWTESRQPSLSWFTQ